MTKLTQDKNKSLYRRIALITGFVLIAFPILILRIFFLQIVQGEKYQTLSLNNRIRLARVKPSRGIIYDRNRRVLTTTRPSYVATIILEDAADLDTELRSLSQILETPVENLYEKISSSSRKKPYHQIILKKDLTFAEVAALEEYKLDLPGVNVEVEAVRSYPENKLAAHSLGYMGEITEKQLQEGKYEGVRGGDQIGQFGLEKVFNSYLTGHEGGKQIEVDAQGREIRILGSKAPAPGDNLILTIDLRLQKFIEELLGDQAGAIIVMNPQNGDVLAMVSRPAFNPNSFASVMSRKEWSSLIKNPLRPLRNRTIHSHYPPGSIFKLIVAISGLDMGILDESTAFHCGGQVQIGRWNFQCWKKAGHGQICLHEAIVHSCNVFFYSAGNKIGAEAIAHYAQLFGLGQPTGICLKNEEPGFIPTPTWKERVLRTKWYPGDTLSMSIGQGYISVTPLQLANLISSIANGGTLYRPKLIRYILNSQAEIIHSFPSQIIRQIKISPLTLQIIQRALLGVVNDHGTGARAMIPNIEVAGKTGTAQIVSLKDQSDDDKELPERLRDHALFCGYAPFENPEIALAILVEHGGKGGATCAPLAREIFLKYFQLKQEPEGEGSV